MNKVPAKEKSKISRAYLNECEHYFESWEKFLDLPEFDPWHRKGGKQENLKSKKSMSKKFKEDEIILNDYFLENDSYEETLRKVDSLRREINGICEKKDAEEDYLDYSHKEMFQLLEKYLNNLPKKNKYGDINHFL